MTVQWQLVWTSVSVQVALIAWYQAVKAHRRVLALKQCLKHLQADENRFTARVEAAIHKGVPQKVNLFTCKQIPPPLPLGEEGDFAFCQVYPAGRFIYGPKRADGWGIGHSLESVPFPMLGAND